jgi:hypothetical protein
MDVIDELEQLLMKMALFRLHKVESQHREQVAVRKTIPRNILEVKRLPNDVFSSLDGHVHFTIEGQVFKLVYMTDTREAKSFCNQHSIQYHNYLSTYYLLKD